ncbi:hypothetical protein SCALM49S_04151 [Streptomyces californicus]
MLALGLFFLVWMKLRPAEAPASPEQDQDPGPGAG